MVVRNDVRGDVAAALADVAVISGGDIALTALGLAQIEASATGTVVIAAADTGDAAEETDPAAPAEGEPGSAGLAVGGLIATNMVLGGAAATMTGGSVQAAGGLDVLADTLTLIRATNAMTATSTGTAVGVTLAFNSLGWDASNIFAQGADALLGTTIGTERPVATRAGIHNASLATGGVVRVLAGATDPEAERTGALIEASVDASTTGGAGSAGVGLVLSMNRVLTSATAEITTDQTGRARDAVGGVLLLPQQGEIETGGPAANAEDVHVKIV